MRRTLVIGALLFVLFAVVNAPAGLLRLFMSDHDRVQVLRPSGTLWNGAAGLIIGGQNAGRVHWSFDPVTILGGTLGYHLHLEAPGQQLAGKLLLAPRTMTLQADGSAGAAFLNQWLANYAISLSGEFEIDALSIRLPHSLTRRYELGAAGGTILWDGGEVRYALGNQAYAGRLPPLEAQLGNRLEAIIYPRDGQVPLLQAEIQPNGFVRIGVTRMLTVMLGNPWSGSGADHEMVVEVEERLF